MKKKHFNPQLFSAICFQLATCFHPAKAQTSRYTNTNHSSFKSNTRKNNYDRYNSWYGSMGGLFSENKPSDISISVPYTSTNLNGMHQPSIFSSNDKNPFPHNYIIADFYHLSIGRKYLFYDGGIGALGALSLNNKGVSNTLTVNTGIGANVWLGKKDNHAQARFLLKPSINFAYSDFSDWLGDVNNRNEYVDVLGITAKPTYNYTSHHHTYTTNATTLSFLLQEQYINLYPKITLTTNPHNHTFYWGIDVAYYIPIYRKENLYLRQNSNDKSTNYAGKIDASDSRINLQYNNNRVSQTPLNFNNLYVGFSIGVNFK
ncbi:MAG: hypothetical protein ABI388_02095 [Bacteroidia bacterium]